MTGGGGGAVWLSTLEGEGTTGAGIVVVGVSMIGGDVCVGDPRSVGVGVAPQCGGVGVPPDSVPSSSTFSGDAAAFSSYSLVDLVNILSTRGATLA